MMTILEFSEKVLQKENRPLTSNEIWNNSTEQQRSEFSTKAKTEQDKIRNINSSILQSIRTHPNDTKFVGIGRWPVRWALKEWHLDVENPSEIGIVENNDDLASQEDVGKKHQAKFHERDLHIILASYVSNDPYFSSCYCKTVYHEQSNREKKGTNAWIHPDIVGVSYPFGDTGGFRSSTLNLMNKFAHSECKLFSFEMKIDVTRTSLRDNVFQAVSNSSWAHEGYLVALDYEEGLEGEMKMLNEAYGIGFIQLDCDDYKKSNRLFPAREKNEIDWNMVDKLSNVNPDFLNFVNTVSADLDNHSITNIRNFDDVFASDQSFKRYVKDKGIREWLDKKTK